MQQAYWGEGCPAVSGGDLQDSTSPPRVPTSHPGAPPSLKPQAASTAPPTPCKTWPLLSPHPTPLHTHINSSNKPGSKILADLPAPGSLRPAPKQDHLHPHPLPLLSPSENSSGPTGSHTRILAVPLSAWPRLPKSFQPPPAPGSYPAGPARPQAAPQCSGERLRLMRGMAWGRTAVP